MVDLGPRDVTMRLAWGGLCFALCIFYPQATNSGSESEHTWKSYDRRRYPATDDDQLLHEDYVDEYLNDGGYQNDPVLHEPVQQHARGRNLGGKYSLDATLGKCNPT